MANQRVILWTSVKGWYQGFFTNKGVVLKWEYDKLSGDTPS